MCAAVAVVMLHSCCFAVAGAALGTPQPAAGEASQAAGTAQAPAAVLAAQWPGHSGTVGHLRAQGAPAAHRDRGCRRAAAAVAMVGRGVVTGTGVAAGVGALGVLGVAGRDTAGEVAALGGRGVVGRDGCRALQTGRWQRADGWRS
jgi:hypothetical protein